MDWLQIRLFGSYFGSFFCLIATAMRLQTSQNLPSNFWIFASALILGQPSSNYFFFVGNPNSTLLAAISRKD
ncbi:MAG: hypothetical protein U9R69_07495, partial [Thermodesulfobacteriota bacterium]|nr:hypothetical protein [Thermodesulfobacteriota bacterium]